MKTVTFDANQWQLVPKVPTDEMLDAASRASMQHLIDCLYDPEKAKEIGSEENVRKTHASRYQSMLAAALTPAAQSAGQEAVAYRLLRRDHNGEWKNDGRAWCDGSPPAVLVDDTASRDGWRIEYAYAAPVNASEPVAYAILASNTGKPSQLTFDKNEAADYRPECVWPLVRQAAPVNGGERAPGRFSVSKEWLQSKLAKCDDSACEAGGLMACEPIEPPATMASAEQTSCLCCGRIGERAAWHMNHSEIYVCMTCKRTVDAPQAGGIDDLEKGAIQDAIDSVLKTQPPGWPYVVGVLKSLCAALSSPAKVGGDEREAFETWCKQEFPGLEVRVQNLLGTYTKSLTEWLYTGWQARAALSADGGEDKRDAERYRWLRKRYIGFDFDWMADNDGNNGKQVICFEMDSGMRIGVDINDAIDAAIAANQARKGE